MRFTTIAAIPSRWKRDGIHFHVSATTKTELVEAIPVSFCSSSRVRHADVRHDQKVHDPRTIFMRNSRWHAHKRWAKSGGGRRDGARENDDGNNPRQHCSSRLTRRQVRSVVPSRFLTRPLRYFPREPVAGIARRRRTRLVRAECPKRSANWSSRRGNIALRPRARRIVENMLPQPGNNDMQLEKFYSYLRWITWVVWATKRAWRNTQDNAVYLAWKMYKKSVSFVV